MTAQGLILDGLRVSRQGEGSPIVDISASIAPGEVLTVMGPSGAGKSTLLAAITGTLERGFAMQGRVVLNGRRLDGLPTRDRRLGLMFQDALLFPHLSVASNLAFALPRGLADRQARVKAALGEAGLTGLGPRDPATLSGGERARVALMRTLLAGPEALLLDEPFSRLDAGLRARIRDFVLGMARTRGLPVVLVTHDPEDARAAGGRILPPAPA